MSVASIAGIIPTMSSVALVSENMRVINKKKTNSKDIMKLGVTNIVGTSLISAQAGLIAGL